MMDFHSWFKRAATLSVAAFALCYTSVHAQSRQIVFDWSPAGSGATGVFQGYGNRDDGPSNFQYWGERISFSETTKIDGMDIFGVAPYGAVGDPVRIRIWSELGNSGNSSALLATISSSLSVVDTDGADPQGLRLHADFPEFTLVGGQNYLIGMTGVGVELTQTVLLSVPGGDGVMARFFTSHDTVGQRNGPGDMAFRLWSTVPVNAVPEVDSIWMLLTGLGAIGLMRHRRIRKMTGE